MNSIANPQSPIGNIHKPRKLVVPRSVGMGWGIEDGVIYQEKMDGRFATRIIYGDNPSRATFIAGEQMPSSHFYAFDCLAITGIDIRQRPYSDRLAYLGSIFTHWKNIIPGDWHLLSHCTNGGEYLKSVLAAGGEGVVRKNLNDPWGVPMLSCKRIETFYCIATEIGASQSVKISRITNFGELKNSDDPACFGDDHFYQAVHSEPCGSVKLGGGKCDRVRVGSILKIEGFGLTRDGKIREPRPCKDSPTSWLIKF